MFWNLCIYQTIRKSILIGRALELREVVISVKKTLHKITAEFAVKTAERTCNKACALGFYQQKLPERFLERLAEMKTR